MYKSNNPTRYDGISNDRHYFYHNIKTDSDTLKGVVRRFSFSLSWLPGMHEWQAWRDALLSPREPSTNMRYQ